MFWPHQPILKEITDKEEIIEPNLEKGGELPEGYHFISDEEIYDFIKKNYKTGDLAITLPKNFAYWIKLEEGIILLLAYKEEPIGSILSLGLNCRFKRKKIKVAHTSFLCVKEDHQKKGLVPHLISHIIEKSHPIQVGYHLTKNKIGENAINIPIWIRPLNFNLCVDLKLFSGDLKKFKKLYPIKSTNLKFKKFNNKDLNKLVQWNKKYGVRLSSNQFKEYLKMPQLTVLDIDGIGWVAYRLEELWDLKKEKKIIIPWLYFAWPTEKLPQLLNLLISYLNAKNNSHPYLLIPEIGDFNEKILKDLKSVQIDEKWLCWYNWTGKYNREELFLPFF